MTQQNESPSAELKRTALFEEHASSGARLVPFAGWEMPIQYTSILSEARDVRSKAGIFDVSHMGRLEITGADSPRFFHRLVTADVVNMPLGRARYTLVCNEQGGIIDDTILYRMGEERFIFIVNASNADTVLDWLRRWRQEWAMDVDINVRTQGDGSDRSSGPLGTEHTSADVLRGPVLHQAVPRRGGPGIRVRGRRLPYGLHRRGRLRGHRFGGERAVALAQLRGRRRDAVRFGSQGRAAPGGRPAASRVGHGRHADASGGGAGTLRKLGQGRFHRPDGPSGDCQSRLTRTLVGFRLIEKGIPRHGYAMLSGEDTIGEVTSGTHSPTLDIGIGLGYVSLEHSNPGTGIAIDIRGRRTEAEVVAIPFYTRKR